jgi:hypothetical protein
MTLSAADEDYRTGKFTGSLAPLVMNARSEAELVKIWRQKVGLDPPDPENYAMRIGSFVEPFVLDESERKTGQAITRRGEIVDHPRNNSICVKLDGFRECDSSVIETKFLSPWRNKEEFVPYYYPQVLLQMLCVDCRSGILLTAQGSTEPVEHEILFDEQYAAELMRRAEAFIRCMQTLTAPYPEKPIIPPSRWRTIDLDAEPTNWTPELLAHLGRYGETAEAADLHAAAGVGARGLIPDDVGKVLISKWQITRDRNGKLSIRPRKEFTMT